jgi:hypothetical protein
MNNLIGISPKIEQPKNIKIQLKEHQKTGIFHMRKLEDDRYISHDYDEDGFYLSPYQLKTLGLQANDIKSIKIYTSYGILADKVGSGKTLMVVGLINNKVQLPDTDKILSSALYSSIQIRDSKKCLKTNLILVPHSLTTQWNDAFKQSKLKYYVISKRKDIDYLEFDDYIEDICEALVIEKEQCLQYYDAIICSANMFTDYYDKFKNTKYSRIIIDEVLQIKLPADFNWCCNFAWFVTATPSGLYTVRRHYIKELIGGMAAYHNLLSIKNNDSFVSDSMKLPDILFKKILCLTPKELLAVRDLIPNDVINMINGNNIQEALKKLNCNIDTNDNIFNILTKRTKIDIEDEQAKLEYINKKNYVDQKLKDESIKSSEDKIKKLKDRLQNIKERIDNFSEDNCPICFENSNKPVVVSCCNNIICLKCIVNVKNLCPFCRLKITTDKMNILDNNFKNKVEKDVKDEKLKNKIVNLIEIIKNKKNGKFLVFSSYDETFNDIIKEFDKNKITYSTILGAVSHINNVINDFSSGKINVVMMNAKHYGSGLNLQMATDVIIYHEMQKELETQVIGRAQRLGRNEPLIVHYLLHENEKCNSNSNLTYEQNDYDQANYDQINAEQLNDAQEYNLNGENDI